METLMILGGVVTLLIWLVVLVVFIAMYFKIEAISEHLKKIRTLIEWQVSKDPK
jgi:hypothetical protein